MKKSKYHFPPADEFGLPKLGTRYVEEMRQKPSRAVSASPNVSAYKTPSLKVGRSIQAESRTVERVSNADAEWSEDITEYYDQPPKIKLTYKSKSGRNVSVWTTPDLGYHHTKYGWVIRESKSKSRIESEAEKSPNRYVLTHNGWECPPGQIAALEYGMKYEIYVPELSDAIFYRNARWLEDYRHDTDNERYDDSINQLIATLSSTGGFSRIIDLIDTGANPDAIYTAILKKEIYFPIRESLLSQPTVSNVYIDESHHIALQHLHKSHLQLHQSTRLFDKQTFTWERQKWAIDKVRDDEVSIKSETGEWLNISKIQINILISCGKAIFDPPSPKQTAAMKRIKDAKSAELIEANRRMNLLNRYWDGDKSVLASHCERTLRNWTKAFRTEELISGSGYAGIIPNHRNKGRREERLSTTEKDLIEESINDDYLTEEKPNAKSSHGLYIERCRSKGIKPVSYETYLKSIKKPRSLHNITHKREGKKSAHQVAPPLKKSSIPVNGDRPWDISHADHTELDIQLCSEITGELFRKPWLSILVDSDSREVLARFLSFRKPSAASVMMLLRDCVYRHNRLPHTIIFDQGPEFFSVYVESLLSMQFVEKGERPPGEPKYGSIQERMNGNINTRLLHYLKGNNKALQNPRSLSKSHDPREHAVWTPTAFLERLDKYMFDIYPSIHHLGINEKPRSRYLRRSKIAGDRPQRYIPFDEHFYRTTMLTPPTGNNTRLIHPHGVKFDGLTYWSNDLRNLAGNKLRYEVRYNPADKGHIFLFIDNTWEELRCTSNIFREYEEMNNEVCYLELEARISNAGYEYRNTDPSLSGFIQETKDIEREVEKATYSRRQPVEIEPDDRATDECLAWLDDSETFSCID